MDGEAFLDEHPLGGRWALPPGGMGSPCLSEVSGVQGVPIGGLGDHGRRQVEAVGRSLGDRESSASWEAFYEELKRQVLKTEELMLGIIDGLPVRKRLL
jgi:hypothetical protein